MGIHCLVYCPTCLVIKKEIGWTFAIRVILFSTWIVDSILRSQGRQEEREMEKF
jgi:hypothetical protein